MLKRYFVTGLLLWVPLVITVWVLNLIVGTMDKSLALLPAQWQPQVWLGRDIPGVGVVLTVLIVLSPHGQAFRKALLVEYPRRGCWTLGFLTGAPSAAMQAKMGVSSGQEEDTMVSVFVPTTPNPTSGFFLMMRREETVELDMSVDAALKYIVSMGVVAPPVGRNEAETNHE